MENMILLTKAEGHGKNNQLFELDLDQLKKIGGRELRFIDVSDGGSSGKDYLQPILERVAKEVNYRGNPNFEKAHIVIVSENVYHRISNLDMFEFIKELKEKIGEVHFSITRYHEIQPLFYISDHVSEMGKLYMN